MNILQSSKEQAASSATSLKTASNNVSQEITVTKDTQTTVAGNTNAQNSIEVSNQTASNSYYDKLEKNVYNRTEKIKKNVDFNEVKDKIYNQLTIKTINDKGLISERPSNINYIKENYPQTYNYIKSVENNQNNI